MKATYREWLEGQKYVPNTIEAQMYRAGRVEQLHGDLDEHFANDQLARLILSLRYSADDKRHGRPNPSKIPFEGDIMSNLAAYRGAIQRYKRFRLSGDDSGGASEQDTAKVSAVELAEEVGQSFGLERDMQASLRLVIDQLEDGLAIIDDGAERSVESGFIDITARDSSGITVVIELKAGVAGQRAVAQILSYMGDIAAEDEDKKVRGILVASDFDSKAMSAARMVPDLKLRRYSFQFKFTDV
jgi:endonuclease